jgi:hypothetical protein
MRAGAPRVLPCDDIFVHSKEGRRCWGNHGIKQWLRADPAVRLQAQIDSELFGLGGG